MDINLDLLTFVFSQASSQVLPMAANLIVALLILLAGFLVAYGLGYVVTLALKFIQLDKGSKLIGFTSLLEKGQIKKTPSELLGSLVYWVILLILVIGVAELFGLKAEAVFAKLFVYVGIVFVAAIVLGLGLFLASLIASLVRLVMENFGLVGAKTASRVIYYTVIFFAFIMALAELGFDPKSLTPHIGIILGAPALAAAIAFGLGCKDMAADFLHNLFKGK